MDIQVGDRVTYRNIENQKERKAIVDNNVYSTSIDWYEDNIGNNIEILKIERPKYEVIEEQKELLTEEEKALLKSIIDNVNQFSCSKVKEIKVDEFDNYNLISCYNRNFYISDIRVNGEFTNLVRGMIYKLSELGLED